MKRMLAALSGITLSLSGCTTLESLRPRLTSQSEIDAGLRDQIPTLPATWQAAQAKIGDVKIGWIDQLGDPILSQFVAEAMINNKDLRVGAANLEQAYALARQAGVPLKPTIAGSGGGNRNTFLSGPIPDTSSLNWGVSASWEPDIWGRLRSIEKNVYTTAQAAESDYVFSQHSIAAAVAQTYFAAIEARLQISVSQKSLNTLSETNRIVNVQYAEGIAMAQDVALSNSDLAARQADVTVAEGRYREALRALEILIGRYPGAELEVASILPPVPDLSPAYTPASLIERRPDIKAAAMRVAAAFYNQDQAELNRLPSLSLTGGTGSTSDQLMDLLNPDQIFINLAGSVTYLIFDGGLNDALIVEADAQRRAALHSYAATVLTALEEVETSLDQMQVLEEQVAALRQSARQANRALEIANIRYSEGEADLLDTLNIEARVVSADSALVSAERALLNEWVSLNLALGGTWENN